MWTDQFIAWNQIDIFSKDAQYFKMKITIKGPNNMTKSTDFTIEKAGVYQSYRYRYIYTLQTYCIVADIKGGKPILTIRGCVKRLGTNWSPGIRNILTYKHDGVFYVRDFNDPYVQTFYIIGDYEWMSWGLSVLEKSSILTSMWIIGSITMLISIVFLVLTILWFLKGQLRTLQQIGLPIPDKWIEIQEKQ